MRDFAKGAAKLLGVVLLIALVAAGVLYAFFVRLVQVGHDGMAPTVMAGDQVLVWRGTDFELGDLVLCPHPHENGRFVMARIVGRPGHTVELARNGELRIDGEAPERDLEGPIDFYDAQRRRTLAYTWGVEDILDHDHPFMFRERHPPSLRPHEVQGGWYLLSDNRSYVGEDSRSFGEVDGATCVGTVFLRLTAAEAPEAFGTAPFQFLE